MGDEAGVVEGGGVHEQVKKDYVDGMTDSVDLVLLAAWRGKVPSPSLRLISGPSLPPSHIGTARVAGGLPPLPHMPP